MARLGRIGILFAVLIACVFVAVPVTHADPVSDGETSIAETDQPVDEEDSLHQPQKDKAHGAQDLVRDGLSGLIHGGPRDDAVSEDGSEYKDSNPGLLRRLAGSAWESFAQSMAETAGRLVITTLTWWIEVPSAKLKDSQSFYLQIQGYTRDIQFIFLVVSVVFIALRFGLSKRGMIQDNAVEAATALFKVLIASCLWIPLVMALTVAGDEFSRWVLSEGTKLSADEVGKVMVASLAGGGGSIMLIVGLLSVLTSLVQMLFLYVRAALLILVAAVLPIAAAAGGTGLGQDVYRRMQSWTIALLLFKPAGALVYFVALMAIDRDDSWESGLAGFILFMLAVFTLPMLMKLIAPSVSQVGAGASMAGVTAGAMGTGATVAGFAGGISAAMGASSVAAGGGFTGAGTAGVSAAGPAPMSIASGAGAVSTAGIGQATGAQTGDSYVSTAGLGQAPGAVSAGGGATGGAYAGVGVPDVGSVAPPAGMSPVEAMMNEPSNYGGFAR